jgi:hypothetical protein
MARFKTLLLLTAGLSLFRLPTPCHAANAAAEPAYLRDRGPGIPTSMFGTYVEPGELLVYPFVELYLDDNAEYAPDELGYVGDDDFEGRFRGSEVLIFLGYGLGSRWALEFEAALNETAELEKSPDDPSDVPQEIEESGLGDVEGQIRYRWAPENERRPEVFSYFEYVLPLQKDKALIGTSDWEFKLGTGLVKGFGFGTMTGRLAVEYSTEESKLELGEYAIEYLRRLSRTWRVFSAIEGSEDEVELIAEAQLHPSERFFIKLGSGFGITPKATDWAPELGVMFRF